MIRHEKLIDVFDNRVKLILKQGNNAKPLNISSDFKNENQMTKSSRIAIYILSFVGIAFLIGIGIGIYVGQPGSIKAADNVYTWSGGGDGTTWASDANWDGPAGYPDDWNDKALINATANDILGPATDLTLGEFETTAGFTGSVTTQAYLWVTNFDSGDGSFVLAGGTINLGGIFSVVSYNQSAGTFNGGSSTVGAANGMTISGGSYTPTSGTTGISGVYTDSVGVTFNDMQIGTEAIATSLGSDLAVDGTLWVYWPGDLATEGYDITVSGDISMIDGGEIDATAGAGGSSTITISGSWTDFNLVPGDSTVVFNGTTAQSVLADNYYNVTISNTSDDGVAFQSAGATGVTIAGTLDIDSSAKKVTFNTLVSGEHTINAITGGGAIGSRVAIVSNTDDQAADIAVAEAVPTLSNVTVKDNDASGGNEITALNSVDLGGNTNWTFTGDNDPADPTSMVQKADGRTVAPGGTTSATSMTYEATLTDPNSQQVQLCQETKLASQAFTNTEDSCGTLVASGSTGSVTVSNLSTLALSDGSYHWQVIAKDSGGRTSSWTSGSTFKVDTGGGGDDDDDSADDDSGDDTADDDDSDSGGAIIGIGNIVAPESLSQSRTNGSEIPVGGVVGSDTVIYSGKVASRDGRKVRLCVEALFETYEYSGEEIACGSFVESGSVASNIITDQPVGRYIWRAITEDESGNRSDWVNFSESTSYIIDLFSPGTTSDIDSVLGEEDLLGKTAIELAGEELRRILNNLSNALGAPMRWIGFPEGTEMVGYGMFTAVAAGVASLAGPISNSLIVPTYIVDSLVSAWNSILVFFGFRRRKEKNWGRIVEAGTGMPVTNAYIQIIKHNIVGNNDEEKVFASTRTDQNGNYRFVVPEGKYSLKVMKKYYEMFNINQQGYYKPGSVFDQSELSNGLVNMKIALSVPDEVLHKRLSTYIKLNKYEKYVNIASYILLSVGSVIAINAVIYYYSTLNLVVLIVYVFLWVLWIYNSIAARKYSPWGETIEKSTEKPVDLALVRVLDEDCKKLVRTTVTDDLGKYTMMLRRSSYKIKAVKSGYALGEPISENIREERGLVRRKVVMKKNP